MRVEARTIRHNFLVAGAATLLGIGNAVIPPQAHADNKRLNDGVLANVYTIQQQAGCTNDVRPDSRLQQAAQRHADDVLANRTLDGDTGSDGSTPQQRAAAAGYALPVAETVAINPAIAISGIELMHQWYYNPAYLSIMQNCANTAIGVWSDNSPDRTVVVAVYGQSPPQSGNVAPDPTPDYDASDEVEFGLNWLPWILRGKYPPPAYPPS